MSRFSQSVGNLTKKIFSDTSGNILVEFALVAPILMSMSVGGLEVANFALTNMRVQQVTLQVADNASRIGEGSLLAALHISERNINDVFAGADAQAGGLTIFGNYTEKDGSNTTTVGKSRIIISSLQPTADPNPTNTYKIGWQRCKGNLTSYTPLYGTFNQASGRNMTGMGPAGRQVTAPVGSAVIFVEMRYRYQPLFNIGWNRVIFGNGLNYKNIDSIAAMMVRDDRDLSQIYNAAPVAPIATC